MDSLDKVLLLELSTDCRVSFSHLSRKYKISPNSVKNRVQKLIEREIILGFITELNPLLFNANTTLISFQFKNKINNEILNKIGNHQLVYGGGVSLDSGFATAFYRTNKELSHLNDFFYSFEDLKALELYPVLPPLSVNDSPPQGHISDLQPIDWLILYHIRDNGRIPLSKLAKKTQVTVKTLKKRIESMKKRNFITLTIRLNPGAISKGMMCIIIVELSKITHLIRFEIEKKIREIRPDNFWVSWQVVDRPKILLAFQAESASEVNAIQYEISKLIPDNISISTVIGGEMRYFPDFTDELLEKKKNEGWFSAEQWERHS